MSQVRAVFVEAPARLHLGLLDLRGDLGRRFGGIGVAIESPALRLEARPAEALTAEGPEAERLREYAGAAARGLGLPSGAALRLHRALPAHAGLGSGTQLALATAHALALLAGRRVEVAALAEATGRARRSAIGTWAFAHGGFVLEGGRKVSEEGPAPLLLRTDLPPAWRCVLAIPDVSRGLSGSAEEQAFRKLEPPAPDLAARVAHLVLMQVLPALVEAEIGAFGRGVTEIQRLVGEMFRPVQGDRFAHPLCAALVDALLAAGAAGAGQSSWGPAVFALASGDAEAARLAEAARARLDGRGSVAVTAFANRGARSWTE
ncbi:MAG TPA: beta-ribofuranosylaminobenzene 5'-phosphate synthase family protein [Vicinamibacteria bacterium]|nr:beta-ribofuranosylaminobenzene 5'-phosphate synthase family protein [Vicinamibacteria bacterium]